MAAALKRGLAGLPQIVGWREKNHAA